MKTNKKIKKQSKAIPKETFQNKKGFASSENKNSRYIFFILLLTAIVFLNIIKNGFTNWDDETYIIDNPFIKDLSFNGINAIFSNTYFSNYHPLTTLTYAVEYHFFGLNPTVYHFTNYILHLLNTLLVFIFIKLISKSIEIPIITALLFAIHPMHVESVAWISERKDVLYTFFFLASLIFYVKHIKHEGRPLKYLVYAFILFVAALMSKVAAVSLPLLMLLIYYFINKNFNTSEILKTLPFFALSVLFGIIALNSQQDAINDPGKMYSLFERFLVTSYSIYFYISRFILPFNFSALHLFQPIGFNGQSVEYFLAPLVLILIIIFVFFRSKEVKHFLIFGLLFFLVNILTVINIISVGQAVVAERYTYVSYIGLAYILAVAYTLINNQTNKKFFIAIGLFYIVFLSTSTYIQNKVWKDSNTLWTKAIDINPLNAEAFADRGAAKIELQDYKGAMEDLNRAIEINPNDKKIFYNRGITKTKTGDNKGAMEDFTAAIKINPNFEKAYNNRGMAKKNMGEYAGVLDDYNKAIEINPDFEDAYYNRGVFKGQILNDLDGAIADFNKAIEIKPNFTEAYCDRGIAHSIKKSFSLALNDFNKAIEIDENYADAYLNLGIAYVNMNNITDACIQFEKAKQKGNKKAINMINTNCK